MSNQEEEFALTPAEIERAEQAWAERNRPEGLVWNEETQQFESEWPALNVNPELQEFIDAGGNVQASADAGTTGEGIPIPEEELQAFYDQETAGQVKKIMSELRGPDANWDKFVNFLSGQGVTTFGNPLDGMGSLEEMWTTFRKQGADSQRLDLGKDKDVQQLTTILTHPNVFEDTFGQTIEELREEYGGDENVIQSVQQGMINDYIENLRSTSRFVLTTGLASDIMAQGDKGAEAVAGDPGAFQDFIHLSFDGTPQGEVETLDDLIAGMSLDPGEIVERLRGLPTQTLSLIQSRLQELGYYDTDQGRMLPKFGINSDEATHNAVKDFVYDVLQAKVNNGGKFSIHNFLFDKRLENVNKYRGITNKIETDAMRNLKNAYTKAGTQQAQIALQAALTESGATLTAKGQTLFDNMMKNSFTNLSAEDKRTLSEEGQIADNERVEQLLAAYYSNGTFTGDWGSNVVVGANSNNDYAHWALISGHITEEEARILATPPNRLPASERSRAGAIRAKLESNSVDIARSAMKYQLDMVGFDPTDPSKSKSDIDILRSFNNTFGKATGPANGYDDSRIMAIGESLGSDAGIDWLSAQEADTSAQDIRDSMTQNALDALNLPENSNYNPNVGAAMSNVLRSIANTGKVGF